VRYVFNELDSPKLRAGIILSTARWTFVETTSERRMCCCSKELNKSHVLSWYSSYFLPATISNFVS
jgi:hypothetical protein